MAEKRMLSKKIINHDNFTTLPATAQALYMHMVMGADDDGFCAETNIAIGKAHAKKKDLDELVKRRYLIRFESGVFAIKHWRMANAIRQDRYQPTEYQEEFSRLTVKPNGAYSMPGAAPDRQPDGGQAGNQTATERQPENDVVARLATRRQPDGNHPQPQVRLDIGKDRLDIGKDNKENDISGISEEIPSRSRSDLQTALDAWNNAGLPKITKLTETTNRGKLMRARIREYGIDDVLKAIENARNSSFLRGQNDRNWQITFDWFVKPNNFCKVLDGNYADKPERGAQNAMGARYEMMKEWARE